MRHPFFSILALSLSAFLTFSCDKNEPADDFDLGKLVDPPKTAQTLAAYLERGKPFNVKEIPVGTIDIVKEGGYSYATMQGMASDGEYLYFALKTSDDKHGKIVKYTVDPFQKVGCSEGDANLGHANDLAYDFVNKNLIIAPMNGNNNIVRFNTATMKDFWNDEVPGFGANVWAISSRTNGDFLLLKGAALFFCDNKFNRQKGYSRNDGTTGYTGQGLGMDDRYAYIPMSSSPRHDNILVVYDIAKDIYVRTLTIEDSDEIESFVYHKGKYYANFITYSSTGKLTGAKVCEIAPE